MRGKLITYPADNVDEKTTRIVTEYTALIPLDDLSAAVGGYIEAVPYWDKFEVDGEFVRAVVWCNEEGKVDNLPRNQHMSDLWEKHLRTKGMGRFTDDGREIDYLVGPIAVTVGDDEFMESL